MHFPCIVSSFGNFSGFRRRLLCSFCKLIACVRRVERNVGPNAWLDVSYQFFELWPVFHRADHNAIQSSQTKNACIIANLSIQSNGRCCWTIPIAKKGWRGDPEPSSCAGAFPRWRCRKATCSRPDAKEPVPSGMILPPRHRGRRDRSTVHAGRTGA